MPLDNANTRTRNSGPKPKQGIAKITLWACLFYVAWNLKSIIAVISKFALVDTDDFLRLSQVRDWMNGQDWYDLTVHRMAVPLGGDMHWSRLVDLPIASLIWFFDLFLETPVAEKIAVIIWPLLLMLITTLLLVLVTDRLFPKASRILTLLFTVTCVSAMVEFSPGRIDHHGFQIMLLALAMCGLANLEKSWGGFLIGASIAVSISIGLDTVLMFIFILAWLGLEWAMNIDANGRNLKNTAFGMIATSIVIYPIFVAPDNWFAVICDANSIVYLAGLLAISVSFICLATLSELVIGFAKRFAVGAATAILCASLLYEPFQACAVGPLSGISPALWDEWLSTILEARGLIGAAEIQPLFWFSAIGYLIFIAVIGLSLVWKDKVKDKKFLAFVMLFLLCALASFIQIRALRVGVIASVPICVWAVHSIWPFLQNRFENHILQKGLLAGSIVMLSAVTWLVFGNIFSSVLQASSAPAIATSNVKFNAEKQHEKTDTPSWYSEATVSFCYQEGYYERLSQLPKANLLNDLNSGPPILVFTHHNILAGNFHRNEKAILDTQRFFASNEEKALEIVKRKKIDYITYCQLIPSLGSNVVDQDIMQSRIIGENLPNWLERISSKNERMLILKVKH